MTPTADRFMRYVDKTAPGGCWLWTGSKSPLGYGRMLIGSRTDGSRRCAVASRLSYELHNGPVSAELSVCHSCDNPSCVNPAHLFLGTHADNMRDRDARGRVQHGQTHYAAKLTEQDVAEIIKQSGFSTQTDIARRFGVDPSNISHILSGKRWKRLQNSIVGAVL